MEEQERMPSILGQRIEKTDKNKYGYVDVDLNDLNINSPVVLCFGGSSVVGRTMSNGLAKFVFNSLNTTPKQSKLKVYSLVYGSYDSAPEDGNLTKQEVEILADKIFMPLVSHNGEKIDVLTAQKNMRNITIVSHCFGMAVSNILSTTITSKMRGLGYEYFEVRSILKQVTNISYAPLKANVYPLFSTIDFYSMRDEYSGYYKEKYASILTSSFANTILEKKENHLSVVAKSVFTELPKKLNPFDEHSLGILKRTENWKLFPKENFDKFSPEEQTLLLKKAKNVDNLFSRANTISICFALCIAESVANSFRNQKTKELEEVDLEKLQDNINSMLESQQKREEKTKKTQKIAKIVAQKEEKISKKNAKNIGLN